MALKFQPPNHQHPFQLLFFLNCWYISLAIHVLGMLIFLCTCKWKSIGIPQVLKILSFEPQPSKIPDLLSSKELYSSPLIEKKFRMAAVCWPRLLCLSLSPAVSKTIGSQSEVRNQKGMYCMRRRIKKEEDKNTSN